MNVYFDVTISSYLHVIAMETNSNNAPISSIFSLRAKYYGNQFVTNFFYVLFGIFVH